MEGTSPSITDLAAVNREDAVAVVTKVVEDAVGVGEEDMEETAAATKLMVVVITTVATTVAVDTVVKHGTRMALLPAGSLLRPLDLLDLGLDLLRLHPVPRTAVLPVALVTAVSATVAEDIKTTDMHSRLLRRKRIRHRGSSTARAGAAAATKARVTSTGHHRVRIADMTTAEVTAAVDIVGAVTTGGIGKTLPLKSAGD